MSEHWDTIEDALETLLAEFYYEEEQEKAIDAALTFVREMREGKWIEVVEPVVRPSFSVDYEAETHRQRRRAGDE